MKNKTVFAIFTSIGGILIIILCLRLTVFQKSGIVRAKVINPVVSNEKNDTVSDSNYDSENVMQTSFVPLLSTETLIDTLTLDFDGDNLDDQVVAVHRAGAANLFLIVGLYNSDSNSYERSAEISTEINKQRTFSFNAIDMIGDHRNALVYQGVNTSGDSVMKIFLCRKMRNMVTVDNIGDFKADGTIFIVQTERSDAYALSQEKGESFSVWAYSSDKAENQDAATSSVSQIQTEYTWNEDAQKYTERRHLKVTGSRIAARELARIQNGNVDTFAHYLSGLWYKTTNEGKKQLYIYFNYDDKEVIFLSDDTEGVYSWETSSLRRSGIYLTIVNSIISSMKRRVDIMLTGVNEVNVHVHEDVGLLIKESDQWDGVYKKMNFQNSFGEVKNVSLESEYLEVLCKTHFWQDDDKNNYIFEGNNYKFVNSDLEEKGIFVMETVGEYPVIQFRSKNAESNLLQSYAVSFKTTEEIVPARRRNQKPTVKKIVDKNIIILTPVKLSPQTCYAVDGRKITLRKPGN